MAEISTFDPVWVDESGHNRKIEIMDTVYQQ